MITVTSGPLPAIFPRLLDYVPVSVCIILCSIQVRLPPQNSVPKPDTFLVQHNVLNGTI